MGVGIELNWNTNRQVAANCWLHCVETVLSSVDRWYVSMILPMRFTMALTDSIRPVVVKRHPKLLTGKGSWEENVDPDEVRVFIQGWMATVDGQAAWSLQAHLETCRLMRGKTPLFGSFEFGSVIEVYLHDERAETKLIEDLTSIGVPSTDINRM